MFYEWLDIRVDLAEQMKTASFFNETKNEKKGRGKNKKWDNVNYNDMLYDEIDWALHNLVNINTLYQVWEQ